MCVEGDILDPERPGFDLWEGGVEPDVINGLYPEAILQKGRGCTDCTLDGEMRTPPPRELHYSLRQVPSTTSNVRIFPLIKYRMWAGHVV